MGPTDEEEEEEIINNRKNLRNSARCWFLL
jgi:hypothetical protein